MDKNEQYLVEYDMTMKIINSILPYIITLVWHCICYRMLMCLIKFGIFIYQEIRSVFQFCLHRQEKKPSILYEACIFKAIFKMSKCILVCFIYFDNGSCIYSQDLISRPYKDVFVLNRYVTTIDIIYYSLKYRKSNRR